MLQGGLSTMPGPRRALSKALVVTPAQGDRCIGLGDGDWTSGKADVGGLTAGGKIWFPILGWKAANNPSGCGMQHGGERLRPVRCKGLQQGLGPEARGAE